MNRNIGTVDRVLRIIVGLALLAFALGYIAPGSAYAWLGWIGVMPILTAIFSFCPAYTLFRMNTCGIAPKKG
jgi:multidrug transporter EmrE-like cation transporter